MTDDETKLPAPRWQKGMASPNPKGRPKQPKNAKEVRALAREYTVQMVEVLTRVALNPKAPPVARSHAAEAVLSRAWGKPSGDFGEGAEVLIIKVIKFAEQTEPEPLVIEHDSGEADG